MREDIEPDREHSQECQNIIETGFLSKDETVQLQEESEATFRDGEPNTQEVIEKGLVKSPQSQQSLSIPQEQHVEQDEGLELSRQHDQLSDDTASKDSPNYSCCTM